MADSVSLRNVRGIAKQTRQKFADLGEACKQALSKGVGSNLSADEKLLLQRVFVGSITNGRMSLHERSNRQLHATQS